MSAGVTYLGFSGTGSFNQFGGNYTLGSMLLGLNTGSQGTYNLFNGTLACFVTQVGYAQTGTFNLYGGTHTCTNSLVVGSATGGNGTYNLNGGTLNAGSLLVGQYGTGTVYQASGNIVLATALDLGVQPGSTGTYNQSGGVTAVPTLSVGTGAGGSGSFNLSGGSLNSAASHIGDFGTGAFTQTGGNNFVTNTLTLAVNPGSSGAYSLEAGTLTAGVIQINSGGTFSQSGGTETGNVINQGVFNFGGGNFNGQLVNYGTCNDSAIYFILGNGMVNFASVQLGANQTVTFNGSGLDNEGAITLSNSTLSGFGRLLNNGSLSGFGTVSGSGGFVNNSLLSLNGGSFTLANTGASYNNGTIDVASGYQFRLTGGGLNNGGTFNLDGGTVAGTAYLINNAGGTVNGPGTILSPFVNYGGIVELDSGALDVTLGFYNAGLVQLTSDTASLDGGLILNNGTLQGVGNVGNALANNGTVEAIGGTLALTGPVTNNATAIFAASTGNKILVTEGLANNAGVINLTGGTFDNNSHALNNLGQVTGFGTFRTGGLLNSGALTFSGGLSTINGTVVNQAGASMTVAYNPAIFTGAVTNFGTVKISGTTVRFTGSYTENGVFNSDPATNYFTDLILGPTGYLLGGARDQFYIADNLVDASAQTNLWNTAQASLIFKGGANHLLQLTGRDLGASYVGYQSNFGWGTVRLGAGETLALANGGSTPNAALYTHTLILEGGLAQVASITGNGLNIYYDPLTPGNAYLNNGTYALSAGGQLAPVTASIRIVSITILTNGQALLTCAGIPNTAHSIHTTTDLTNWSVLGTATADSSGAFTFTDTNAPSFSVRFYRLSVP